MDFFIARQPIFNAHRKLYAYELLYRGTQDATIENINGERATSSLISSAFLTEGLEVISGTRPCFINFTEDLLLKKIPLSIPKNKIVVEILEDVRPTKEIVEACKQLVNQGYTLALDDFVYHKSLEPLIELAEIIKIDFRLTPVDTIHKTLYRLRRFNLKLLAEKVETIEEFSHAIKLGFTYFQGYFFSRPENIRIKELTAAKINMFRLLAEVSLKSTTLEKLHKIISVDISISYKLLRFLNSAYFYRLEKVKTVKHAIAYLGERELRRFILLVLISELSSDKPDELVRMALVRAKFCELLGEASSFSYDSSELFLLGMFSFIDVMLDSPMTQIMEKLPVSPLVKSALNDQSGDYAVFLDIMRFYERKQILQLDMAFREIGVDDSQVPELYLKSLKYANGLF
ncbi:EAL and HDOD domain-containing protein [Desulfopila aestuarii]|uniref:EAL and modified HD-GYP domain-containing signal transduction protein n=1 Tax=Desulfopila aestuarii DSM 18488 TaxID=1121416 RepID=A0A1M7Y3F8_9BACT|nr:HDOD domain-containing protein [Desulfopila aestuarii]SHO46396.1 EAL and modified HD-GYP domain-containing signal transduction protein [Desulfopila aestuarii DSM 18488]